MTEKTSEVAFDIETIPDARMLRKMPLVHPDRNLRDPEKIKKNLEAKKARQIEEAALKAQLGKVICVALYGVEEGGSQSELVILDKNERRLLRQFWKAAEKFDRFITFNGIEFHLPFLLTRSWLSDVKPTINIDMRRYRPINHLDLRMVLSNWDRHASGTLEDFARLKLDVSPEAVTGAEIYEFYRLREYEKIKEHCLTGAMLTWLLYRSMKGILV